MLKSKVINFVKELIRIQAAKFECPAIEKSEEQITVALLSGIISDDEAIKNLNNSEYKFVKICVKNGDPVEFGQVLMYVE